MKHIKRNWLIFTAMTAIAIGVVSYAHSRSQATDRVATSLFIYCAAALQPVIEQAAEEYEQAHGIRIQAQYGASGTLLSNIELTMQGDLFLPADDSFLDRACEKRLVREVYPLAYMTPVMAMHRDNTAHIHTFGDVIATSKLKVAFAHPEAASIAKVTKAVLEQSGEWADFQQRITVTLPTVTDVANAVTLRTADIGVVWDAVARQRPTLRIIPIPVLQQARQRVAVGVLTTSTQQDEARRFAEFLCSDKGRAIFAVGGYDIGGER